MRIPKQVSLTKSLALTISLVLLVSGIVYVLAAAPSSTFWLAPGVYPGAPSFTVWREGNNYFAKNANGEIEFSGTNASQIINNAIESAGGYEYDNGHGIVECFGELTLDSPVNITVNKWSRFIFKFDRLIFSSNKNGICVNSTGGGVAWNGKIEGNYIRTSTVAYTYSAVLLFNVEWGVVEIGQIRGAGDTGVGIQLYANGTECSLNTIRINKISGYKTGILLSTTNAGKALENNFYDTHIVYVKNGVYSNGSSIGANKFYGIAVDGTGGALEYGFYLYSEDNVCFGCMVHDVVLGVIIYEYRATGSYTGNLRLQLYGCYASYGNFSSGIKHYGTQVADSTNPAGYVTEYAGTSEASNDDWISIGLEMAGTPQTIILTVQESDARYIAQVKASNASHFQLYLYDETAGAAEDVDKTISWSVEYQP